DWKGWTGRKGREGKIVPPHSPFLPIPPEKLSLQRQQERLLECFDNPAQESDSIRAVDQSMVVRERQREHKPWYELARLLVVHRFHACARDPENRHFWRIDYRREKRATDAAEIRDAEATALHLVERDLAVAGLLGQLRQLH